MKYPDIRTVEVTLDIGKVCLQGELAIPRGSSGIVLFAHGSGSSRHSPRNQFVAKVLNNSGLSTLLFDLLTASEEKVDMKTRELRFNIPLLADRLVGVVDGLSKNSAVQDMKIGLFGASTGAAAALIAAAERPDIVSAVVSRGGRPDLAGTSLPKVAAPTLMIVGGDDEPVIKMNEAAGLRIQGIHRIEIVPGASHLFEEPGTLEAVADLACQWFGHYLSEENQG